MVEPAWWYPDEPTLSEILADPIIQALMEADGVDADELEATLRRLAVSHAPPPPARAAPQSGTAAGSNAARRCI
jgi:hypothetical protein